MMICAPCSNAYDDDMRATCNSLLRVKTPYPQRSTCEELASRVVGCVCSPLKCLEGLGMMACGLLLWPIPCTVCRVGTRHHGEYVSLLDCCLDFRCTNHTCYFEDRYMKEIQGGYNIENASGCYADCILCEHQYNLPFDSFTASSTVTGLCCIKAGAEKISQTIVNMVCCPFSCCCAGLNVACDCCCPTPPARQAM